MNLCCRRVRHPRRCRYRGGGGGSATTARMTPLALLDMVFRPDINFFSGISAGDNSTASTDRGNTADLLFASLPLSVVTRRAGPLIPAVRIRRGVLLSCTPKEPDGSHPALGARAGPSSKSVPPRLKHNPASYETMCPGSIEVHERHPWVISKPDDGPHLGQVCHCYCWSGRLNLPPEPSLFSPPEVQVISAHS